MEYLDGGYNKSQNLSKKGMMSNQLDLSMNGLEPNFERESPHNSVGGFHLPKLISPR